MFDFNNCLRVFKEDHFKRMSPKDGMLNYIMYWHPSFIINMQQKHIFVNDQSIIISI